MSFISKIKAGAKRMNKKDKIWAFVCFAVAIGCFIYFITLFF